MDTHAHKTRHGTVPSRSLWRIQRDARHRRHNNMNSKANTTIRFLISSTKCWSACAHTHTNTIRVIMIDLIKVAAFAFSCAFNSLLYNAHNPSSTTTTTSHSDPACAKLAVHEIVYYYSRSLYESAGIRRRRRRRRLTAPQQWMSMPSGHALRANQDDASQGSVS